MKRVYLGGSNGEGSTWRNALIERLKIEFIFPAPYEFSDTPARLAAESDRHACDVDLHVLTPCCTEFYHIANLMRESVLRPNKVVFSMLREDGGKVFNDRELILIEEVMLMVAETGGQPLPYSIDAIADHLNSLHVELPFNPNVIECLIQRDGPTVLTLGKRTYTFEDNENGDCVCEVLSSEHRQYLLKLPDFRIYKEDELPKPEFTYDEDQFIREWKTLSKMRYQAYVNAHIRRFVEASVKIRGIAAEKWVALMPDIGCPIPTGEDDRGHDQAPAPGEAYLNWSNHEWTAWQKKWVRLNAENFRAYVEAHEIEMLNAPDDIYDSARAKWEKLIKGQAWPIEEEEAA
ncbi:MAG: hypothetical protein HGJ94_18325 [Desulfosarcina sp.]|nr:hypothetical protein [Desulfosarcina sp.]